MKIGIITPNNIWVSPYVKIYTRLLDELSMSYDVISWNREGRDEEGIQFNYQPKSRNPLMLLWAYRRFASFAKSTIRKEKYDRLIVFTPQSAIFLADFLKKEYKDRYIFDYRDLSLEQKMIFKKPFLTVLKNSAANIISSPGFKKYLPEGFDYIVSHNFDVNIVRNAINGDVTPLKTNEISVLTIGAIRKDMNPEVIDALGNKEGVTLSFVGKGPASKDLEDYANLKEYRNITFRGFYQKADEPAIINDCNFINIFYPQIPSHQTAVSNRFYNSLIFKRPMIVTKNSTQGDYAEKYDVGIAITDCSNLHSDLKGYLMQLDFPAYCERCNKLLTELLSDYELWRKTILRILS